MKINIDNYEAYYLDYLEGNLNQQDAEELSLFLQNHPEFQLDEPQLFHFENIENIELPANFKNKLSEIPLHQNEFKDLCIGRIEGTLNENETKKLHEYLTADTQFLSEFELFTQTKLIADKSIIYPFKSKLKKGKSIRFIPYAAILAAASMVGFIYLSYMPEMKTNLNTAHIKKVKNKIPHTHTNSNTTAYIAKTHPIFNQKTIKINSPLKDSVTGINQINPLNQAITLNDYTSVNNQTVAQVNELIKENNVITNQPNNNNSVISSRNEKKIRIPFIEEKRALFNELKNELTGISFKDQKEVFAADLTSFHEKISTKTNSLFDNLTKNKETVLSFFKR